MLKKNLRKLSIMALTLLMGATMITPAFATVDNNTEKKASDYIQKVDKNVEKKTTTDNDGTEVLEINDWNSETVKTTPADMIGMTGIAVLTQEAGREKEIGDNQASVTVQLGTFAPEGVIVGLKIKKHDTKPFKVNKMLMNDYAIDIYNKQKADGKEDWQLFTASDKNYLYLVFNVPKTTKLTGSNDETIIQEIVFDKEMTKTLFGKDNKMEVQYFVEARPLAEKIDFSSDDEIFAKYFNDYFTKEAPGGEFTLQAQPDKRTCVFVSFSDYKVLPKMKTEYNSVYRKEMNDNTVNGKKSVEVAKEKENNKNKLLVIGISTAVAVAVAIGLIIYFKNRDKINTKKRMKQAEKNRKKNAEKKQ